MPRAAKVGHKKSRLGCQRCKCDEQKPICGSCQRHGAECVYLEVRAHLSPEDSFETVQPRRRRSQARSQSRQRSSPTADMFPRDLTERDDPEIPESKARRMMELRLMQNNLLNMVHGPPSSARGIDDWLQLWRTMPELSLEHNNVLYASFALSATHLLRSSPDDDELYAARQNYYVLALREQRKECAHLDAKNTEAVCMTSLLILRNSFALMQERSLDQYKPPIEWLKMGRGAAAVMWKASAAVTPEIPTSFKFFLESYQRVLAEQTVQQDLDRPFSHVFAGIVEQRPDMEDQQAYRKTMSYINFLQKAVDNGEPIFIVSRMLQAFPMIVPSHFIDMVEEQDPYALVVLAHYFGIPAQIDDEFWWLKGSAQSAERTAVREINAINAQVHEQCGSMMSWPLMRAERGNRSS
ncbi:hypothetical protein LTR24_005482 [Lithohypha guttulata]|uniref:Zn(2)-C6 fungal-type domain-containing protein n=1 Tax=Lithohypha guttulata TaxID=1690604 RepID=A0ABR0KAQ2_9EURO|nr:hypothetical protein LTR24_005482 [Lithohypha guttulata]